MLFMIYLLEVVVVLLVSHLLHSILLVLHLLNSYFIILFKDELLFEQGYNDCKENFNNLKHLEEVA